MKKSLTICIPEDRIKTFLSTKKSLFHHKDLNWCKFNFFRVSSLWEPAKQTGVREEKMRGDKDWWKFKA